MAINRQRGTPQVTIEAIMFAVLLRGVGALKDSANVERLSRCNAMAKTEINRRIARLIVEKEIAA
jgi:hypothetical protein